MCQGVLKARGETHLDLRHIQNIVSIQHYFIFLLIDHNSLDISFLLLLVPMVLYKVQKRLVKEGTLDEWTFLVLCDQLIIHLS